jgi:hypothetical protein
VSFVGDEVEAMFTSRFDSRIHGYVSDSTCALCRQTARDEKKRANRWLPKCRKAINTHADKFVARGVASSRSEFVERFGWDLRAMAHEVEHAYTNGCPYCHQPFGKMGNGPRDITLDVIDPEQPPYYRTNCRWVCSTCNSAKARTPPRLFGARLAAAEKWRKARESEWPPGCLFNQGGG